MAQETTGVRKKVTPHKACQAVQQTKTQAVGTKQQGQNVRLGLTDRFFLICLGVSEPVQNCAN